MQNPERFLDIKCTISIIAIVVIINVAVKGVPCKKLLQTFELTVQLLICCSIKG